MPDYVRKGFVASDRIALAASLAAAYPGSYGGFGDNGIDTMFHFDGDVPTDIETTLAPFTVSASSKALANLLTTLAADSALDQTTRDTAAQMAATLDPAA